MSVLICTKRTTILKIGVDGNKNKSFKTKKKLSKKLNRSH